MRLRTLSGGGQRGAARLSIDWKLYFDDDTTWTNEDGAWEDAPKLGVVVLVIRDPSGQWGRWVHSGYQPPTDYPKGNDYYVKHPAENEPYATDKEGLGLFLKRQGAAEACVKYGAMVPYKKWTAIQDKAVHDPDFPRGTPKRRSTDR